MLGGLLSSQFCHEGAGSARGSVCLGADAEVDAADLRRLNTLDRPVRFE